MTKKKYFKYKFYCNSAYYASLIAMLVVGMIIGRRIQPTTKNAPVQISGPQMEVVSADTIKTSAAPATQKPPIMPITKDNNTSILRHKIDSLSAANMAMFDSVAERYCAKLDSRYTLGLFFNQSEIMQLHKLLAQYMNDSLVGDTLLNTAKEILPLTQKTPLVTLEALIAIANISEQDLAKFDIVFDSEHIDRFTNAAKQRVLEQYLRAYTKVSTATGEPNFLVPEIASIRQQYDANRRQIANLKNQIQEKSGH